MVDFVRQVRQLVDETARRRGRSIALGVRVLPTLKGNTLMGLDVPAWLEEDLIDFIVPIFYANENMDQNLPFEELASLARAHDCYTYPGIRSLLSQGVGAPVGLPGDVPRRRDKLSPQGGRRAVHDAV